MTNSFIIQGPQQAKATVVLAHGAGAAMDSVVMTEIAGALVEQDLQVVRFEFQYMASRRSGGPRRPPPRVDKLIPEYLAAIDALCPAGALIIGGKSMGGRVASMIADDLFACDRIAGLICLGYPFHPPNAPDKLRTQHLQTLRTPTLICQGTRDPFGTRQDVGGYGLPSSIKLRWLEDGDHDLKPRKRVSGMSQQDHINTVATSVTEWMSTLGF